MTKERTAERFALWFSGEDDENIDHFEFYEFTHKLIPCEGKEAYILKYMNDAGEWIEWGIVGSGWSSRKEIKNDQRKQSLRHTV